MHIESLNRSNRCLLRTEYLFLFATAFLFIQSTNLYAQSVLFVDADAMGIDDGSDWTNAFPILQDALAEANARNTDGDGLNDISEIWVATGTYTPDDKSCSVVGDCVGPGGGLSCTSNLCDWNSPREQTFQLLNNVAIYGGFDGTETLLSQRDIVTNVTTLSGDQFGNDTTEDCTVDSPDCDSNGGKCLESGVCIVKNFISENSYHVTTGSGTDNTAVIDGFTITAGNADVCCLVNDSGAGMFNDTGSPTVANCIFSGNKGVAGGGMFNSSGSNPTVSDCTFENNSANAGGGMYNVSGSGPTLTNCTFSGNSAFNGGGIFNTSSSNPTVSNCTFDNNSANIGGGMFNDGSNPTLTNCTFNANSAGSNGGGMFNIDSSPTVTSCTFSDNTAGDGGGMYNASASNPTITNCTFSGNTTSTPGGGMYNNNSNPTVNNCIFNGNSASSGGGMFNTLTSNPTVTDCTFSDNSATGAGGGMYNFNSSSPTVSDCTFNGNSATSSGGMFNFNSSPTVTNCFFFMNTAVGSGGGVGSANGDPVFKHCTFSKNSSGNLGGGMSVGSVTVTNCIFEGNSSQNGGGVIGGSGTKLIGCRFVENTASVSGGGIITVSGNMIVTGCTFISNSANGGGAISVQNAGALPEITNCIFAGNSALGGGGGISCINNSVPTVTNSTFFSNSAFIGGGIAAVAGCSVDITNSILWNNTDNGEMDESAQIHDGGGTAVVNYSIVQGLTGNLGGVGNIDADPLFVDADGADNIVGTHDDNLRLLPESPAIDQGDNDEVPADTADLDGDLNTTEPIPFDLDGNARFVDDPGVTDCLAGGCGTPPIVDMGAYEFTPPIFVDASAVGANDGTSWSDAYLSLAEAIGEAGVILHDVWVADGTYMPDGGYTPVGGLHVSGTGARAATFQLFNGVSIYGGFAGGETSLDQRDIVANVTTLSGDIGAIGDNTDNSYHVNTGSGTNNTAVIDGFTITAGNANGSATFNRGAGMYNNSGSPTLTDCTFNGNWATFGGGMFNSINSNPTITDCMFSGNSASGSGGGIHNGSSSPTVTNCTFSGNSAPSGGGMYNTFTSSPTVTNCTFSGNSATSVGGGMDNINSSSPTVTDCTFSGNSASSAGGGMSSIDNSNPTVTNCTFSGNSSFFGGGMYNVFNCSPMVTNCTFSGNTANIIGGGMFNHNSSSPTLTDCTFNANSTLDSGGGMYNINSSDPTLNNCTFNANSAGFDGGAIYNFDSSPKLINCTFNANSAGSSGSGSGGGMYNTFTSSPTVTNCTFSGNSANSGGGMSNFNSSNPTINSCIFSINSTDSTGGGMFNDNSSPTLTNCTFSENSVPTAGGGMFNSNISNPILSNCTFSQNSAASLGGGAMFNSNNSNLTLSNCTFIDNSSTSGGAIYNSGSNPSVIDCNFSGNSASNGGGMYNVSNSSPIVTNCAFNANSAISNGGGMFNNNSSPTVTNCTFSGNSASSTGGGMYNFDNSSPMLTDCKFSGNSATFGGGMYNTGSSNPMVTDCTFSGNSANNQGGAMYNTNSSPTLTNCTFCENSSNNQGGGMFNWTSSNPTVTDCTFRGNYSVATHGGGMFNFDSNPAVTNCTFSGNSAEFLGGGIFNILASPTLTNCTFSDNSAGSNGGGIYNGSHSNPTVTNCTFSGNFAEFLGGGMFNSNSSPTLANCTLSGNSVTMDGGGMFNEGSSPTVTNCILWENSDVGGNDESAQIHTDSGTPLVNYSLVQGLDTFTGGGNIDADPLFVNADGLDNIPGTIDDDLRLQPTSPAIDAGDNTAVPVDTIDLDNDGDTTELTPWDIAGNLRFVDNPGVADTGNPGPPGPIDRIVDMGAYENGSLPDCNGNDIPDDQDIAGVTSDDCNGNLIPDECDLDNCTGEPFCSDCNSNSTIDICDINDCDGSAACEDCNLNGVPDSCDIASGASLDSNTDGIPDECSTTTVVGNTDNWTDNTNWDLGSDYPDNDGHAGNVYVTIDDNRTIFLDDTVEIPALKVLEGATLKITQADPGADLLIVPGTVAGDGNVVNGTQLVANDNTIDLCSSGTCLDMKILGGGVFEHDPTSVDGTSCVGANPQVCTTLKTGNLIISDDNPDEGLVPCTESGGSMILEGDMKVIVNGDFILGSDTSCTNTVAGERLPPIKHIRNNATLSLSGDFILLGSGTISYSSTQPIIVGCNYDNRSTQPENYEMTTLDNSTGGIMMCLGDPNCTCTKDIINCPTCNNGAGYQTFEVAGENLGITDGGFNRLEVDTNFSLDRLQIGYGVAEQTDSTAGNVIFINDYINTIGTGACQEALYVRDLDIKPGSTVTLDNVVVYYDNPSVIIEDHITVDRIGCGDLISLNCHAETPLADPSGINKSRYLSLIPGNNGSSVAIRVRMVNLDGFSLFNGEVRWVGLPEEFSESDGSLDKFWSSLLVCAPHYQDWGSIDLLHLFGSEVVPLSNYEVQLIREDCSAGIEDENAYSESIPLQTGHWGDVIAPFDPPEGTTQPNIDDVLAIVGKWLGNLNPLKTLAQLQPNIPNPSTDVSIDDVLACVNAWLGSLYPYDGPESCPP